MILVIIINLIHIKDITNILYTKLWEIGEKILSKIFLLFTCKCIKTPQTNAFLKPSVQTWQIIESVTILIRSTCVYKLKTSGIFLGKISNQVDQNVKNYTYLVIGGRERGDIPFDTWIFIIGAQ